MPQESSQPIAALVSQLNSLISNLRNYLPSDLSSIWSFIAGISGGFIVALLAEPLRQRMFRPNLTIEFKRDDRFVTNTVGRDEAGREWRQRYIRVRVQNTRRLAKNCRAYLTNVEQLNPDGIFESTGYIDSIQVKWSARGEEALNGIDLPKGVNQFVDVIMTQETIPSFIPQTAISLYRYDEIWKRQGTFRFTVLVSGDGVKPKFVKLRFVWRGRWDDFEADAG